LKWVPEITHHCPNTPFILVGNKLDLRDDPDTITRLAERRQTPISTAEGVQMAERVKAFAYVEK